MNYINRETGELLSYSEMIKQFHEEYDGGDDTSLITFDDIYIPIEDVNSEDQACNVVGYCPFDNKIDGFPCLNCPRR